MSSAAFRLYCGPHIVGHEALYQGLIGIVKTRSKNDLCPKGTTICTFPLTSTVHYPGWLNPDPTGFGSEFWRGRVF